MAASAGLRGVHPGVAQVAFAEIDAAEEIATIASDWNDGSMASNVGCHGIAGLNGPVVRLKRGEAVVVTDVATDPRTCSPEIIARYRRISVAAFINAPLFRNRRLVAILVVHSGTPREWSAQDMVRVHGVAERTWLAVERVRAEAALLANEARQALLLRLVQSQRETGDPKAMMLAAAEAVGRHLDTDRVGFLDMMDDATLSFTVGWTNGRLRLLSGDFPVEGLGAAYLAALRQSQVLGIANAEQNPLTANSRFAKFEACAVIGVPIVSNERRTSPARMGRSPATTWRSR